MGTAIKPLRTSLRGTSLSQPNEYHGALNVIAGANNSTRVITVAWPLFRFYSRYWPLIRISSKRPIYGVSGITFMFHDNALLAAQILGLRMFNNEFRYRGAARGNEVGQLTRSATPNFTTICLTTQTESLKCSARQTAGMFTATRSMDILTPGAATRRETQFTVSRAYRAQSSAGTLISGNWT
jgi:hypothetical protein